MAAADAKDVNTGWKKRESLPSALIQIVLVAALLGSVVFFVIQRGHKRKDVSDKLREARNTAVRDNPADIKKALGQLDEILAIDADSPGALSTAAHLETDLWLFHKVPGAEQKAKDFLAHAERADPKAQEDRMGTKAEHLLVTQGPQAANDFLEELRKKGAASAKLFYVQGLALKAQGNIKLSRQAFAMAVDKAWKDPEYSAAFGEAFLDEGQPVQAIDAFNKAISANPDHFRSRLGLALARVYRKTSVKDAADTAVEVLGKEKEAELSPGLKARALALKAELYNFETQYDEAVAAANAALAVNPDDIWALYARARALGLKKDAGAAAAFDAAVAKARTAPQFYFEGATLMQAAGNTTGALALLDKYEAAFKGITNDTADGKKENQLDRDDRYWLTRGDVMRDSGKLDEALAFYDKAIAAKNLALVKATYAKASVYMAKKDYDKAAELLPSITPVDGTGQIPEAYWALGEVLFSKKDWATGCQMFAFALTKHKQNSVPREQLNAMLTDVEKKLITAGQKPVARLWVDEAKPMIQ